MPVVMVVEVVLAVVAEMVVKRVIYGWFGDGGDGVVK